MALKIFNKLFTGPFKLEEYEYKKNKKDTVIIFVKKIGKNYAPEFYCIHVILGQNKDIIIKDYFEKNVNSKIDKNINIFIKEYSNNEKEEMKLIHDKIKKEILETKKIKMEY
tara:strand:+ start:474 stop:809 length:336 start_codon:yes stop_codon:yes gene_type:complete